MGRTVELIILAWGRYEEMDCLIQFCSDSYQKRLRLLVQSRSERYEDTLEIYKKMFIAHYQNVMKKCKDGKCSNSDTCSLVYKTLKKIEINQIENFFDGLRSAYLKWIDADSISAIQGFEELLKKYRIIDNCNAQNIAGIYFKGREEKDVLTAWDMFHIPFNKRYLIRNQRYSLTGQPLMYIGSSVIDIAEELDVDDIDKLKVSAIQLPEDIKLYDLRNNIYEELNLLEGEFILGNADASFQNVFLFKLILASACSFQKRQELKQYNFCEEYVLPQILAQIVKNHDYDGIIYYSTKAYEKVDAESDELSYKENIALFTKTATDHVYDRQLFDKLNISVPIDKSRTEKVFIKDIQDVHSEIGKTMQQEKIAKADKLVSSFKRIYDKMKIDGVEYAETEFGQLHMYHLFAVLNQILM